MISGAVLSRACLRLVLCAVCFAVVCWCLLLFAAVLCAVSVLGCPAVSPLSWRRCAVLCCAVVVWCACAVLLIWSVLFLTPGALMRSCALCCFLWCSAVCRCAALLGAWCAGLFDAVP